MPITNQQISRVLKAGATLWVAPVGEPFPDESTVAAGADWGGEWENLGLTSAPLVVKVDEERAALKVEQFLGAVRRDRTDQMVSFETVLAEITADNLALAMGGVTAAPVAAGAGQVGYEQADIGGQNCSLAEYAVGVEGVSCDAQAGALPVRLFMWRATLTMNGELKFSKNSDEYAGIPLLAEGLASLESGSYGRLMRFQRVTAPATS